MIVSTLIFFSPQVHERILALPGRIIYFLRPKPSGDLHKHKTTNPALIWLFGCFFALQLLLPLRCWLYPGELFWTEQGYRFSWRVMLMDKVGYAHFRIVDELSGKSFYVDNADFLTPFQEKQMSTQPDFILEYAHYLKNYFTEQGHRNIGVYVDSYVALNGRKSGQYIDPDVELTQHPPSLKAKNWILPFHHDIQGF
jgi:hypothetical protein